MRYICVILFNRIEFQIRTGYRNFNPTARYFFIFCSPIYFHLSGKLLIFAQKQNHGSKKILF